MAFNGENGTLRYLRARPATYDQRVDSSVNDTGIINRRFYWKARLYEHIDNK